MPWTAYIDESSDEKKEHVFAMGGCVSSTDRWLTVEAEWTEQLALHDLSCFHATDCEGGFREFDGWSREKRD
ncbi:MAG: hypothetical protein ABUL72_03965, partial [Armatimonadota bacterium]